MNWRVYTSMCSIGHISNEVTIQTYVGKVDDLDAVFLVLTHYNRNGNIKKYSAWVQNREHATIGGDNFALKIKNCHTRESAMAICEEYYQNYLDGKENNFKCIGTQYFSDDIYEFRNFLD